MDQPRKRGRPKGSKDRPRPPGAPRRGRPPNQPDVLETPPSSSNFHTLPAGFDADDEYDFDDDGNIDADAWEALDKDIQTVYGSIRVQTPEPPQNTPTYPQLLAAAQKSQTRPFFTQSANFSPEGGNESESDLESQDEGDENPENDESASGNTWFRKPDYMPDWLYRYFHRVIRPLITQKDRGHLLPPAGFTGDVSKYKFDPYLMFRLRIFLWLPHFFVDQLNCPNCGGKLEKNGALTPRRIIDTDSNFYIVSWAYYCRSNPNCRKHFHGWSQKLIESLPRYLQLAFPAILSRKSGVSRNVMNQLRIGNQHKMGPSGVRSLLLELHTLRFSILQAQYLEAVFEMVRGRQDGKTGEFQSRLDSFLTERIPPFGDFGDRNGYAGFVPSERYLSSMLNKAIELDEPHADQHTACQRVDHLTVDDNHKINKHIATVDGQPIFGALWTCMNSRGIRAQALTLTKSHEERIGPLKSIAKSVKLYGFHDPLVVFTDDPLKDKRLIYEAFPSLARNLAPPVSSNGLASLEIPSTIQIRVLPSDTLTDQVFSTYLASLDVDPTAHLCVSLDAEWNTSRTVGVSILQIAPHSDNVIYIVPVHRFKTLPTSLLRVLISDRVFKIGSCVKADLTRLQKQFSQLRDQTSFNVIDLKEYAIQRGVIGRKDAGGLDTLVEKVLGRSLSKDPSYAALDAFASRRIFEAVTRIAPLDHVQHDTTPGTRVALLVQEGGEVAAYGKISAVQTPSFQGVRVAVPSKSRVIIDIHDLCLPTAAAVLHLLPKDTNSARRTKAGVYSLGQLQQSSLDSASGFSVVSPISLLQFDRRNPSERENLMSLSEHLTPTSTHEVNAPPSVALSAPSNHPDATSAESDPESSSEGMQTEQHTNDSEDVHIEILRAQFSRALRDHLLRWDPVARQAVDEVCRKSFGITFEIMLSRHPDYIKRRVPRYVPPPRVIVPALEHIFNSYGNAMDAQSGFPLFKKKNWEKAHAVLDLARQGYLSDLQGVPMYEKAGIDKDGLQKWKSERGTSKLEGGPHGDIYRKFGALNAGPRLAVNSLTDHRTHYNLQANAKHVHNVDWDYHHSLPLINRISFLLNYLSGIVKGAESYSEWLNADLYEQTTERFGICPGPESLRLRLQMEPYNEETADRFKMKQGSVDWLRRRQGVALPILPPSTREAREFFFQKMRVFATTAAQDGKQTVDYTEFAREWNRTADGKTRYYITTEVLIAYAKTWHKNNNTRASQELISKQLQVVSQTRDIFAAPDQPFPSFLTGSAESVEPSTGVRDVSEWGSVPDSLSTALAVSRPRDIFEKEPNSWKNHPGPSTSAAATQHSSDYGLGISFSRARGFEHAIGRADQNYSVTQPVPSTSSSTATTGYGLIQEYEHSFDTHQGFNSDIEMASPNPSVISLLEL
ncbi:hypothetical protein C8R43DRAFT_1179242 [Mycena crocata]|nr:hypothetical protein C8R43DRAFT_1179242 [Mycena crocata]